MSFLSHFQKYRNLYMGIAILMVILYHMDCVTHIPLALRYSERYLYLGVDIFMCASGFGLCYAIGKYSTLTFYKRRILRIYPSYLVMALAVTALHLIGGEHFSVWDWFCQLSTLQYYCVGGHFFDWYLSALILLYLFYPLLYKCQSPYTPFLLFLAGFLSIVMIPQPWMIQALVARIGIFAYGILMYRVLKQGVSSRYLLTNGIGFAMISPLPFFLYEKFGHVDFVFSAGITPLLMYLIFAAHQRTESIVCIRGISRLLSWLGQYSLSVYIANVAVMHTMSVILHSVNVVSYCGLQLIYGALFIAIERYLLRPLTQRLMS